ncbi:MAG: AMP-binding protein [Lachnospiraceae bacterium]|nr:AMP-binding protein [Lachnospiraceae bacterium]
MFDTLIRRIGELAQTQPEKPAVAFRKEVLTYRELYRKAQTIGTSLREDFGVKKNDRVLFTALSKPEMAAIYLGIQYCGAVAVFADKNSTAENAAAIYEDSESVLFLTDKPMKGYEDTIRLFSLKTIYAMDTHSLPAPAKYELPDPDDMAEMLFTSGTTGKPKGVVLSYRSVIHILQNTITGIGIRPDERLLLPLPLNHSFALRVLRAVLYQGATVVLQNGFTFAKEIENNQTAWNCTALAAVPASMEILRSQMQDMFVPVMSRFRYIETGAGSLTVEQRKRLTAQLPDTVIYNTWGSSETGGALFLNVTEAVQHPKHVYALGKPLPNVQVQVQDETGKAIQSDEQHPGRMAIRGDMVMSGYWHREELNRQTLKDGWLLTGDLVYTDDDGYVYMLGRADDIINVGGEKVAPIEVENIACEYTGIRECACIGVPDPDGVLGQIPALFVVPTDAAFSEKELQKFLAGRMERYKLPQKYILLNELPRNRMGKIDRKAIRELYEKPKEQDLMNPVIQAILTRRSVRRFTETPIPKEKLDMILKAGYYAPTGHNMQSWRFTVIQNKETIASMKTLIGKVAKEKNIIMYGFENPSCLVLISNDRRNPDGCQDASCAAENMFLAAHSYGIGSVWLNPLMTICDEPEIRAMLDGFGVPSQHIVWSMAAFGYAAAQGTLLARKTGVIRYVDSD